jgi:hypothetical protein
VRVSLGAAGDFTAATPRRRVEALAAFAALKSRIDWPILRRGCVQTM